MNVASPLRPEQPEVGSDATVGGQSKARPASMSLRAKGLIALITFILYTVLIGVVTEIERGKLVAMVDDLEQAHLAEEDLAHISMSMARTLLAVNQSFIAGELAIPPRTIATEIETTLSLISAVGDWQPELLMLSHEIRALVEDYLSEPNRAVLAVARTKLNELFVEVDSAMLDTRERKRQLLTRYYDGFDRISMQGLAMGAVGFMLLGALTTIFFNRLTWDIRKLEEHALGIVSGNRDAPLCVTRNDELGSLMNSVNQMQCELRQRERHIERVRQEQFHREKMAAVGSLAAQLAHEINNPIAAINGVATSMEEIRQARRCAGDGALCQPQLILQQSRRISMITRQISEFTRPRARAPELLDVNQLVRSTCSFVGYDSRFGGIALETVLDNELPAVRGVADHIVQVLMNVMINAADAVEEVKDKRSAYIQVKTLATDEAVVIEITDNGVGMDADTLARAFDEYFTTKPIDRGSGLGLPMCRELMHEAGGSIELESRRGEGTCARIFLSAQVHHET